MTESNFVTITDDDIKKTLSPESLLQLSRDERPIDYSDIQEIPDDILEHAQKERRDRLGCERVPLDLDIEVIDWFKKTVSRLAKSNEQCIAMLYAKPKCKIIFPLISGFTQFQKSPQFLL